MEKSQMPGFMSNEDMKKATDKSNQAGKFSKELRPFKPQNIKMLVNLSELEPGILEYGDGDIEEGQVCQIMIFPDGRIAVGFFNDQGSGGGGTTFDDPKKLKENVHFRFE